MNCFNVVFQVIHANNLVINIHFTAHIANFLHYSVEALDRLKFHSGIGLVLYLPNKVTTSSTEIFRDHLRKKGGISATLSNF